MKCLVLMPSESLGSDLQILQQFSYSPLHLKKKNYLLLPMLGVHCCMGFSLIAASGGYSLGVVYSLLISMASLIAEHRL